MPYAKQRNMANVIFAMENLLINFIMSTPDSLVKIKRDPQQAVAPPLERASRLCDNCPGGPICARAQYGPPHRRPSAVEQPMVERRKPIVTELALADALDQLVNLIEELQTDVDLRVEITPMRPSW